MKGERERDMNINGYILREEISCFEGSNLKSPWNCLTLTGCMIWQKQIGLRSCYAYIMYAKELEKLPDSETALTILCIGTPSQKVIEQKNLDLLWTKEFLQPSLLLSMTLNIIKKYRQYTETLSALCSHNQDDTELKEFLLETFHNPLLILGTYQEVLKTCENMDIYRFPCQIQEPGSDFLSRPVQKLFDGIPYFQYHLYRDGRISLRLYIISVIHPITDRDRILLIHTAEYLECWMDQIRFNPYQGLRHFHQSLQQAIQTHSEQAVQPDSRCVREGLEAIGFKVSDTYLCIVLETANGIPADITDILRSDLLTQRGIMLQTENGYLFLVNLNAAACTEQTIINYLEEKCKSSALMYGISTPFQNFYDFPDYSRQAQAAIQIGREINYSKKIYPFWEYALDYIIYEGWDSLPLSVILYGHLKEMIYYDRQHHTQYCATLKTFFQNYMTMAPTAKALNIHISTLKYRLHRIHEMLDLDLNDPTNKMYLQIMMYILD